jgi:hypothetical protein
VEKEFFGEKTLICVRKDRGIIECGNFRGKGVGQTLLRPV